jgi:hypothetical protein
MKGVVDLSKVKVIEKVLDGAFDKPSFQVHNCHMYIAPAPVYWL